MKKIKIERSLKLRKEDLRRRNYNILTNNIEPEDIWLNSFGKQKEADFYKTAMPKIESFHDPIWTIILSVKQIQPDLHDVTGVD